jgi:hypothetical protein
MSSRRQRGADHMLATFKYLRHEPPVVVEVDATDRQVSALCPLCGLPAMRWVDIVPVPDRRRWWAPSRAKPRPQVVGQQSLDPARCDERAIPWTGLVGRHSDIDCRTASGASGMATCRSCCQSIRSKVRAADNMEIDNDNLAHPR